MQPQDLDWVIDGDHAAVDREAAVGDHVGEIARGDRAIELAGISRRTNGRERLAVELGVDGLGFFLKFEVARFELHAAALEILAVLIGGAQGLALRQQEVAGKAVFDGDDIAHLAEAADTFEQDHLHENSMSWLRRVRCGWSKTSRRQRDRRRDNASAQMKDCFRDPE